MMECYKSFEELVELNLPKDSKVQSTGIVKSEDTGSVFLQVCYEVSDEYQKKNELWYKNRLMHIRLFKGENDQGLPISSCANRMEE
jgi:hypothetical protein